MKISEIRLENFKCFDNIEVSLNKLTLITGANSSGKSSLIYGLLTPLQSGEYPFSYSTNGKYVNMGDYEDIAYLHDKNKKIKIGFSFINSKNLTVDTYWTYDKIRKLPILNELEASTDFYNLSIKPTSNKSEFLLKFTYDSSRDSSTSIESFEFQKKINVLINETLEKETDGKYKFDKYLKKLENKFKKNDKQISIKGETIEAVLKQVDTKGSFALTSVIASLNAIFNRLDNKVNYISSFRFHPQKFRNEITKDNLRIGKYGDNYEDQILSWQTKKSSHFNELMNHLKQLGVLQDIKTTRITGGNFELKIKTHASGTYSSMTDVGFGISQFMPILVSDIQLGKESTLFISQPEIHLHPKIQSEFGDYLCNQMYKSDKNYIVETHSEYLINKIRLLIVQKKIKVEDVSVYYFKKKGNKTEKHTLQFTEDGQIKNAPSDFFETYMSDVLEIALNA